jgi:aminodeoxyfutalosine deaminase
VSGREFAVAWAWLPDGLRRDVRVRVDAAGVLVEVGSLAPGQIVQDGLLLPGLVNAHAHLELSQMRGQVPGGQGSVAWVEALMGAGLAPDLEANEGAAREARATGTRWLIDVSNGGDTGRHMEAAGLGGVVQVECIGVDPARWGAQLAAARGRVGSADVEVRPTAHSPISCAPGLMSAALQSGRAPFSGPAATIHVDEDPADRQLLRDREGPWARFHDRIGHDWRGGLGQGEGGVAVLDALALLGPHLGLVHLVHAGEQGLDRVASCGATAVLCPRSNLHISGVTPDVTGMLRRGIPLALGTDSLASTPDMDLLAEGAVLAQAFPDVAPSTWMTAMTTGGAALLGVRARALGAGRLQVGASPGLLLVALPRTTEPLACLFDGTAWPREWIA